MFHKKVSLSSQVHMGAGIYIGSDPPKPTTWLCHYSIRCYIDITQLISIKFNQEEKANKLMILLMS